MGKVYIFQFQMFILNYTYCIVGSFYFSRPIMAYLVNQYGKDDSLYPKNAKDRALVDQRLYFDMGSLYHGIVEYYVSFNVYDNDTTFIFS